MEKNKQLLRLVVMSMLIALGVVISPLLRIEGMCPMAHFINILCAVLLGPGYAFLCAAAIGIIRMAVMGIPLDRRRSPPVPSAGMQDASASRVAGPGHSYWTEGRHGHG